MMRRIAILFLCTALIGACSKKDKNDKSATKSTDMTEADKVAAVKAATDKAAADKAAADKAAAEEEEKRKKRIARIAELSAKDAEKAAEELKRWDDAMRAGVKKLVETEHKDVKSALEAAVKSPHRVPGNADRDPYRHPVETLVFLGLQPDMTVLEAGVGRGWYSEIIGPVVAKKGKLLMLSGDPAGPADSFGTLRAKRVKAFMDKSPEIFGNAATVILTEEKKSWGADSSVDMVVAFREMHGWTRRDQLDGNLSEIHRVLKPGGIFGVVQHRTENGKDGKETAKNGYLPQDWLVAQVEKKGFKLAEASEINANPKDTRDHPEGVWTLPPGFALKDKDREKYAAIGESDRMTLKFVKMADATAPAAGAPSK